MYNLLMQKEYRTKVVFYSLITICVLGELMYSLIHPENYLVLAFFAAFRVVDIHMIKNMIPEKTYSKMYWSINCISLFGIIYFLCHSNTDSYIYNALMLFFIGANNVFFKDYQETQIEKEDIIKAV